MTHAAQCQGATLSKTESGGRRRCLYLISPRKPPVSSLNREPWAITYELSYSNSLYPGGFRVNKTEAGSALLNEETGWAIFYHPHCLAQIPDIVVAVTHHRNYHKFPFLKINWN